MSRSRWIALAGALALLAALAVWLTVESRPHDPSEGPLARAAATLPAHASTAPPGTAANGGRTAADTSAARATLEVAPGSARSSADESLRHVRGRVRFPSCTPSDEAAEIVARAQQLGFEMRPFGPVHVATDASFDLLVPKHTTASYALHLEARWCFLREPLSVRDSEQDEDLGELQAELGARIEGRIVLPAGAPLPTRPIRIELGTSPHVLLSKQRSTEGQATEAGSDLGFAFNAVPAGRALWLRATGAGFRPVSQPLAELPAGEVARVELALERGASVSGVVVDRRGKPIGNALVRRLRPPAHGSELLVPDDTDAQGQFELDGLPPGSCDLLASHASHPARLVRVEALGPEEVRRDLRIELADFLTLECELVDERGEAVPHASVLVLDLEHPDAPLADLERSYASTTSLDSGAEFGTEERWSNSVRGLRSDGSGLVHFEKLAAGRVVLAACKGELVARTATPVELRESGSARVRLELRPGACVFVLVHGDPHPQLPDARVRVLDADGIDCTMKPFVATNPLRKEARELVPGIDGVPIGPLPPGTYRAIATRKDGARAQTSFTVQGREPQQVDLRFPDDDR